MEDAQLRRLVVLIAVVAIIGAGVLFGLFILVDFTQAYWPRIIEAQFAAVVGLPMAAVAAFIVVALFRQTEGPIEIEGPGFKLKGATGPVILWALCFWVIAWAIGALWK